MNGELNYGQDLRTYLIGYGLALILTLASFAAVALNGIELAHRLALITIFGLIQLLVHFRFFLHIDLSRQKREDLQLILFSVLLLAIMAGGTIWIMANLTTRMH